MNKKILPLLLVFLVLFFVMPNASSTQVIVINDTLEKVYSLETITISGDLQTNSLKISGTGEIISGENVKVYLFGPASDILVKNLKVNNAPTSVSFDDKGYFFVLNNPKRGDVIALVENSLVPSNSKFSLSGDLEIRTLGQIKIYIPGPLNELKFDLQHGYAVKGDRFGLYGETIVIQRSEKVAMVVDGTFKFTYAEKNEFYYIINFKSFGSSLGQYVLELRNGETVSDVTGVMKWEQQGNQLILELESDEATVSVSGYFNSQNLRVPLKEDKHHVLIESDPEKKITISTSAKEIDVSESPLAPTYSNARAFLASYSDNFAISIQQLGTLPSLAASVSYATNKIAITEKGSVVGELQYNYANTGVDYIQVDVDGDPLYAATDRAPVKLTKDQGKLFLSFPKTQYGNLDMVYFTTRALNNIIDLVDIPIAKTDLPITTATTMIYLPKDYFVLETFGAPGGSELPDGKSIILFVIITGIIGFVFMKNINFVISYIVFSGALYVFDYRLFLLMVALTIIKIIKRNLPKASWKWIVAGGLVLVVLFVVVFVAFSFIGSMSSIAPTTRTTGALGADYAMVQEATAPMFKGVEKIGTGEGAITVPTREGVYPVKLEIPSLGKTITVTNHLVTSEQPIELKVLLVAGWFVYIIYFIGLLAGLSCYRMNKK